MFRDLSSVTGVPFDVLLDLPPGAFDQLIECVVSRDQWVIDPKLRE